MNHNDYKNYVKSHSKKELVELLMSDPYLKEKFEVELYGGTHIAKNRGCDGVKLDDNGVLEEIEIKTCRLTDYSPINGTIIYSRPSQKGLEYKIKSNETIITSGYDKDGNCLYRFQFLFDDCMPKYKAAVDEKKPNASICFSEYSNSKTFELTYINKKLIKKEDFAPNMFEYLSKI